MAEEPSRFEYVGPDETIPGFAVMRVMLGEMAVRTVSVRVGSRFSERPKPSVIFLDEDN